MEHHARHRDDLRPYAAVSRRRLRWPLAWWLSLLLGVSGCGLLGARFAGPAPDGNNGPIPNPLVVPVADIDFTWMQIVDLVDDYFEIASEQQVREIDGILMQGRIATKPLTGATLLEPLRPDSTPGFERWQSTLQSIRRQALVLVTPAAGGFEVYVEVQKELEDVSQPEFSTVGRAVERNEGSVSTFEGFQDQLGPITLGWIPLGRDLTLEQQMLKQLYARLFETTSPPPSP